MTTISRTNDSLPLGGGEPEPERVEEPAAARDTTASTKCNELISDLVSQISLFVGSATRELEVAVDVAEDSGAGKDGETSFRDAVRAGLEALTGLTAKLQRLDEEKFFLPNVPKVMERGFVLTVEINDSVQLFDEAYEDCDWRSFPVCASLLGRVSMMLRAAQSDAESLVLWKLRSIVLEPDPSAVIDRTAELRDANEVRSGVMGKLDTIFPPNNAVTDAQVIVTKAVGQGSLAIGIVSDLIETMAYTKSRDAVFDDFVQLLYPMERVYRESRRHALGVVSNSEATEVRKLFDHIDAEYSARKEKLRELLRAVALPESLMGPEAL